MSETLFKKTDYSLNKLIEDIAMGDIGLPELQRPFVWPNIKVRDLFDSMYKGFPVGYLLFWSNGAAEHGHHIGIGRKQQPARLLVIDGQQRLTSLYAVMKGVPVKRVNFKEELISIGFNPLTEEFVVADASTPKDPQFIPNISVVWSTNTDIFQVADNYLERLGSYREITPDDKTRIRASIQYLANLKNYPFTALELSSSMDEEQVSDVFVRINSKGTSLNQADFILTLMSVFWDEGRKELEEFCRSSRQPSTAGPSPFNYFLQPDPADLLRVAVALAFRRARLQYVYLILRGKDLETGEFSDERREQQFITLREAQNHVLNVQNWHDFMKVLVKAGFRSNRFVTSKTGLIYTYALYLIGQKYFKIDRFSLRNLMACWFFMQALTGRYTSSPETAMEADLARLREVSDGQGFINLLGRVIADTLTEDFWSITLPNDLATSTAHSPSLFAYYASLNLLDARVLFSPMKVSELMDPAAKGYRAPLERHHLFPKAYLAKQGISQTRETNQIANYALVEWPDNQDILDDPPADYVPAYEARFNEDELKKMHYWHALPEDWQNMDYQHFLESRRKLMAKVIRDGFEVLRSQSA